MMPEIKYKVLTPGSFPRHRLDVSRVRILAHGKSPWRWLGYFRAWMLKSTNTLHHIHLSLLLFIVSLALGFMQFSARQLQRLRAAMASNTPLVTDSTKKSPNLLLATAGDLQKDLSSGLLTSVELINACYDQAERYDGYLRALISKPPRASLIEQARRLDSERKKNEIRSRLHGIPILVKVFHPLSFPGLQSDSRAQDNIATLPELQMGTTAGSFALAGSRPESNAEIIQRVAYFP